MTSRGVCDLSCGGCAEGPKGCRTGPGDHCLLQPDHLCSRQGSAATQLHSESGLAPWHLLMHTEHLQTLSLLAQRNQRCLSNLTLGNLGSPGYSPHNTRSKGLSFLPTSAPASDPVAPIPFRLASFRSLPSSPSTAPLNVFATLALALSPPLWSHPPLALPPPRCWWESECWTSMTTTRCC